MIHELKIKPEYFAAVVSGNKTFEIRNNADRNFQVGDTLLLWEWDGGFTSQTVERSVSYITDFEQKPGYVVLGLVNHREHELLEKFHRTGVAIERAISTGSVLADHPLKSRLELLANHHEREMELVAQLSDATRQCGVMAGLLLEANDSVYFHLESPDSRLSGEEAGKLIALTESIADALAGKLHICQSVSPLLDRIGLLTFLLRELRDDVEGEWCFPGNLDERIDAALAGTLPEPASSGNVDWSRFPGWLIDHHEGDTITEEMLQFALSDMLAAAPDPESTKGRAITEGQEFELTTVLQAIANGFSDDPAHDAAALLKRITGEVPWTGDSFQIPPRQGGEPCATEHPSSSPD